MRSFAVGLGTAARVARDVKRRAAELGRKILRRRAAAERGRMSATVHPHDPTAAADGPTPGDGAWAGFHHIGLDLTVGGIGSRITLDGAEINGVRRIALSAGVDEITTVTLEMICRATVTAQAEVMGTAPADPAPEVP